MRFTVIGLVTLSCLLLGECLETKSLLTQNLSPLMATQDLREKQFLGLGIIKLKIKCKCTSVHEYYAKYVYVCFIFINSCHLLFCCKMFLATISSIIISDGAEYQSRYFREEWQLHTGLLWWDLHNHQNMSPF